MTDRAQFSEFWHVEVFIFYSCCKTSATQWEKMINLTRLLGTNYDRGKIYRIFMITWFIFGEFLLDYAQYKRKFEIFQTSIGISWFADIIVSGIIWSGFYFFVVLFSYILFKCNKLIDMLYVTAFVCLLEEIFDIEKRNHSTKLCFYFTRALTFDSFYITSMIILMKIMLDSKTGNNFLLDIAWIYTSVLYMAMYSLNDWLLIYHNIKMVRFSFIFLHLNETVQLIRKKTHTLLFD